MRKYLSRRPALLIFLVFWPLSLLWYVGIDGWLILPFRVYAYYTTLIFAGICLAATLMYRIEVNIRWMASRSRARKRLCQV